MEDKIIMRGEKCWEAVGESGRGESGFCFCLPSRSSINAMIYHHSAPEGRFGVVEFSNYFNHVSSRLRQLGERRS